MSARDLEVATRCLGCGHPWRTHMAYDPATATVVLSMQHEGHAVRQALAVAAIDGGGQPLLDAVIEHSTQRLAAETRCFERTEWTLGDPRLGGIGSVA